MVNLKWRWFCKKSVLYRAMYCLIGGDGSIYICIVTDLQDSNGRNLELQDLPVFLVSEEL